MKPGQILKLRLALGLSRDELASQMGYEGIQRALTVYRWETGRRKPSAPVMKMLEHMAKGRKV
jgi:DNA-binding transcriptional regulator YiaG